MDSIVKRKLAAAAAKLAQSPTPDAVPCALQGDDTVVVGDMILEGSKEIARLRQLEDGRVVVLSPEGATIAVVAEDEDAVVAYRIGRQRYTRAKLEYDVVTFVEHGGEIIEVPFGMTGEQWLAKQQAASLARFVRRRKVLED